MVSSLTLPQALMLLALRDDKGSLHAGYFPQALAGASLTELLLVDALESNGEAKPKYTCESATNVEGKLLSAIAGYIMKDGRSRPLKSWAGRLSQKTKFIDILAEALCELGAVSESKSKFLGLIPQTKWPTLNGRIEAQLIEEIKNALNSNQSLEDVDDKVGLIIVLADAGGFLKPNLDKELYKASKERLKEMKKAEFLNSKEFVKVIEETQAAIIGIIVATAVVPAVTAS